LKIESGRKTASYHPIVLFKAEYDASFTFTDSFGSNLPLYYKGESVRVLYDPDNPANAIIDGGYWWNTVGVMVFFMLFAASFVMPIVLWRIWLKEENDQKKYQDDFEYLNSRTRFFLQNIPSK
jgi:hypothetical protein